MKEKFIHTYILYALKKPCIHKCIFRIRKKKSKIS